MLSVGVSEQVAKILYVFVGDLCECITSNKSDAPNCSSYRNSTLEPLRSEHLSTPDNRQPACLQVIAAHIYKMTSKSGHKLKQQAKS